MLCLTDKELPALSMDPKGLDCSMERSSGDPASEPLGDLEQVAEPLRTVSQL